MLKTVSLTFQDTTVDFLFFYYDHEQLSPCETMFHKHMNFELHFALGGSYEYTFSDRTVLLQKNHMLIIPPGVLHKAVDSSREEYRFRVLTLKFSSEKTDGFYEFLTSAFLNRALESIEVQDEIMRSVSALCAEIDAKSYLQSLYLHSCASKVLYRLCDFLAEDREKKLPETDMHLEVQIENLVNRRDLSLSDIAEAINYSPRQTERLIKQIYGKSLTKIREDFQ